MHDDELPTEKSKTSLPMKWNQPPKKTVAPACANDMTFIKPSHGDAPQAESSQPAHHHTFEPFEPHCSEHCTLNKESLDRLLAGIEESVLTTGLQQFWHTKAPDAEVPQMLWNNAIFLSNIFLQWSVIVFYTHCCTVL